MFVITKKICGRTTATWGVNVWTQTRSVPTWVLRALCLCQQVWSIRFVFILITQFHSRKCCSF